MLAMNEPIPQTAVSTPKRRRLRFGLRGLLGVVLVMGLIFGWVARLQRQAREREVLVAELARERIYVNSPEPTALCLFLMKVLSTGSVRVTDRCSKWLGPGWFSYPKGFNAGRMKAEQVPAVVERLRGLGTVWEVEYTQPSLLGLRLFYIDRVPYQHLGPERSTCIVKRHAPHGEGP
jgi:hypothetical protein